MAVLGPTSCMWCMYVNAKVHLLRLLHRVLRAMRAPVRLRVVCDRLRAILLRWLLLLLLLHPLRWLWWLAPRPLGCDPLLQILHALTERRHAARSGCYRRGAIRWSDLETASTRVSSKAVGFRTLRTRHFIGPLMTTPQAVRSVHTSLRAFELTPPTPLHVSILSTCMGTARLRSYVHERIEIV